MIGLKKSSVFKLGRAMAMDRPQGEAVQFAASVRDAGAFAVELVLRTDASRSRGYCSDERNRRAVYGYALLWEPENGMYASACWIYREPETCSEADAGDGNLGDGSWAKHKPEAGRTRCLSLSASWVDDPAAGSCLEYRYHLHPFVEGFCVPGSGFGLVQPIRFILAAIQQFGDGLLPRGTRRSAGDWESGYFQYGSGVPVYEYAFC